MLRTLIYGTAGYFDCLRGELKHSGVSVTVISPGYINTSLSLNAVTSTGKAYGVTDPTTAAGMSPKWAATQALLAISAEETDYILADAKTIAAVQARAQFPYLLSLLTAAKEKGKGKD